jgi:hypothetical protein
MRSLAGTLMVSVLLLATIAGGLVLIMQGAAQ